ncbi:MAG: crossover junction endodeoxyribonuclease RuvC [Candidatus Paceibacterota bacterium]
MKNNPKIILGIDPGYDRMGVCVLEKINNTENKILFSVCLESNKKDDLNERIFQIGKELEKIIIKYSVDELAIEKLFFTTNQKTAMGVAESRGAVIFLCKNLKVKIFEYTPLQIKNALTGYGKADKNQVYFMLDKILKLNNKLNKKYDDEYDAIAIAYTHSISIK